MATDIRLKEALPEITEAVVATYTECSRTSHLGHKPLPSREAVVEILDDLHGHSLSRLLSPAESAHRQRRVSRRRPDRRPARQADAANRPRPAPRARAACRPENAADVDLEALAQQKTVELLRRLPDVRDDARTGRAGRLRGRPGGQELSRDHLLLSRPGGGDDLSHRSRIAAARRAADPAHDDGSTPTRRPASTSIPGHGSARASSSTTAPAWSSARPATSARTSSSIRA